LVTEATKIRRLYVLLCGYEILPKIVSTRDRGSRFILAEPVCSYFADTMQGTVKANAPDGKVDQGRVVGCRALANQVLSVSLSSPAKFQDRQRLIKILFTATAQVRVNSPEARPVQFL
jgi:hypothetical protein